MELAREFTKLTEEEKDQILDKASGAPDRDKVEYYKNIEGWASTERIYRLHWALHSGPNLASTPAGNYFNFNEWFIFPSQAQLSPWF